MVINLKNFLLSQKQKLKIGDFQDLDHVDGVAISAISADLYKEPRDDLVLFYFRDGANYASVYTQSKIISENIKWNLRSKNNSIKALLVNTRNANAFTGKLGFKGITQIAEELSKKLTIKMIEDEEKINSVQPNQILFGCTGTIGEVFPTQKIKQAIPNLIKKIKYTQNKYLWMKAALGIMTTDLQPKLAMEICKIGNSEIKIYGIAKGSGMIFPNMATTLGYIFTDANAAYRFAGKTGTAQIFGIGDDEKYEKDKIPEHLRDHALFIGFAPVKEPKIALAIIVENGGGGSSTAAPIARKLLDHYLLDDSGKLK